MDLIRSRDMRQMEKEADVRFWRSSGARCFMMTPVGTVINRMLCKGWCPFRCPSGTSMFDGFAFFLSFLWVVLEEITCGVRRLKSA